MRSTFIRALSEVDKSVVIRLSLDPAASSNARHEVDPASFGVVPRSPFAYWVSQSFRRLFSTCPPMDASGRAVRIGLSTFDDLRFLRLAWEVPERHRKWLPFAKGGAHSPFYSDLSLVVDYSRAGREIAVFRYQLRPREGHLHRAQEFYGRPGLTWSRRSQRGLSLRVLPAGSVIADKGPAIFDFHDTATRLASTLAAGNSQGFRALVDVQMAFGSFETGVIARTPVPDLTPADEAALAALARRAWSLKRSLDTRTETSHAFVLPALLQVPGATLAARAAAWAARVRDAEAELAAIRAEIDERCFELYGIGEEDRRAITEGFGGSSADAEGSEEASRGETEGEDEEEAEASADTATLVAELVSWAGGVAFGRFDVCLATGERELPPEPDPFDPLPVCSPAMLTGEDGLPLDQPPAGYPIAFPEDGILVDEPGHPRDIVAAARKVFDTVLGSQTDAIWQEAAELLDPKGHDLRNWLRSAFFEHHLRRHSKSRRRAPILWQLGIPSARYSIWLYAHRLTRDSLFALNRDIVAAKLALEEGRLTSLRQEAGPNPTAKQRAEIAAQEAFVEELRIMAEEVRRVAPLWNPDLDDGIVLVSAPLWRLVPIHKPWQKELKSRWDDLVAGKYDWAHMAMHLWPERVVPKCATDRSLAIAHGLEDAFWVEGADGKWTKRSQPTHSVDQLVAERTKPAVKAALADLLAAPAPAGVGGRRRKAA
jgi:hypothetical protein